MPFGAELGRSGAGSTRCGSTRRQASDPRRTIGKVICHALAALCVLLAGVDSTQAASGDGAEDAKARTASVSEQQSRPNIILIIGDDHAWPDSGFMGSEVVSTPKLNALARSGTVFTHGFNTSSVCKPSLRTLYTGLQPIQWWDRIERMRQAGEPRADFRRLLNKTPTLPRRLSTLGYATFMGGKLWESDFTRVGFAEGTQDKRGTNAKKPLTSLGRTTMKPVLDFIDRNLDQPFFLWYAPLLPHLPFDAPRLIVKWYEKRGVPAEMIPYYANCSRLDSSIGVLMQHLVLRGLRDRTIVVYVSDNGWEHSSKRTRRKVGGDRGKGSLHQLGLRTPVIFSWPGKIREHAVEDGIMSTTDIVPTLLELAGAPIPHGLPGRSLAATFTGEPLEPRTSAIGAMWVSKTEDEDKSSRSFKGNGYFVARRDWHYIWYRGQAHCEALYDLAADPDERTDVSSLHPDITLARREEIRDWLKQMRVPDFGFQRLFEKHKLRPTTARALPGRCPWNVPTDPGRAGS